MSLLGIAYYGCDHRQYRSLSRVADIHTRQYNDISHDEMLACMEDIVALIEDYVDIGGSMHLAIRKFSFNDIYLTFME